MTSENESDLFRFCPPPPQYVMSLPPITQHVSLHSKSLCKNMARASGGGGAWQLICVFWDAGHKRKRSKKSCSINAFLSYLSFCCKTNNQIHYLYLVGCKIFCSIIECWNFPIAVIFLWNGPSLFQEACFLNKNPAIYESIISLLDPCIFFASLIYPLHILHGVSVCNISQIHKTFWMLYILKHSRAPFKMPKVWSARSQNARNCYLARSWISLTFVIL